MFCNSVCKIRCASAGVPLAVVCLFYVLELLWIYPEVLWLDAHIYDVKFSTYSPWGKFCSIHKCYDCWEASRWLSPTPSLQRLIQVRRPQTLQCLPIVPNFILTLISFAYCLHNLLKFNVYFCLFISFLLHSLWSLGSYGHMSLETREARLENADFSSLGCSLRLYF